jgi:hypothetical protein
MVVIWYARSRVKDQYRISNLECPVDQAAIAPTADLGTLAQQCRFPKLSKLNSTCFQRLPSRSLRPNTERRVVQLGLSQLISLALTHNSVSAPQDGIADIAFQAGLAHSNRGLRPRRLTRDLCFSRKILRAQRMARRGSFDHWRRLPGMSVLQPTRYVY